MIPKIIVWKIDPPTSLIDSQKSCSFILRVIGNDDANKQRQPNHATQKDEDVDINGMDLKENNSFYLIWLLKNNSTKLKYRS